MIQYNGPKEIEKEIVMISGKLKLIDQNDIVIIFPDFVEKRDNTIGSGTVIISEEFIYPCSIPDIGCGFHLVKLNEVSAKDILNNEALLKTLKSIYEGGVAILSEGKYSIEDMCKYGHQYSSMLFSDDENKYRSQKYEDGGRFGEEIRELSRNIFYEGYDLKDLDRFQGHFFEFLVDDKSPDDIYLLIHSGSYILADKFMEFYWEKFARISYSNKWSNQEQVINGYFKLPLSYIKKECPSYLQDVNGMQNFAMAYRYILEVEIVAILEKMLKKKIMVELLSDYIHTKLLVTRDKVIHQRGVQDVKPSSDTEYLISGSSSIPSMTMKVKEGQEHNFFSHGIPTKLTQKENVVNICYNHILQNSIFQRLLTPILTVKGI